MSNPALRRKTPVFIGPPGSGKTTLAKHLAAELNLTHVDTDDLVEQQANKSVSDIFLDDGEPAFRQLEQAAVAAALHETNSVISLGGGAILAPVTQQLLKSVDKTHLIIYLTVNLATASKRVGFNTARPLLLTNPRAQWQKLNAERAPIYQELAQLTLDTSLTSPADLVAMILPELTNDLSEGSKK